MKPVIVVGTVFVDVKGFPTAPLDFAGRNLGQVHFAQGGVGRNVAETLALMGAPVRFVSSVTAGGLGDEVLGRLQHAGVDTGSVAALPAAGNGMWLALFHHHGDVACSISQMPDLSGMKAIWASERDRILADAGLCVLEIDLDADIAAQVLAAASAARVPVVGLPGNFSVIRERPDLLRHLHALVVNQHEAELLLGETVDVGTAAQMAVRLRALGPEIAVITLGGAGAAAAGPVGVMQIPAIPVAVVDTTGAGDAFVSGFSFGLAAGAALPAALACAMRVAAWTVSGHENVCIDLQERMQADDWAGWHSLHRR